MCASASSPVSIATTVPLIEIHVYGSSWPWIEHRHPRVAPDVAVLHPPAAVFTSTCPSSSASTQSDVACGEPSSFSVTKCAKFVARQQLEVVGGELGHRVTPPPSAARGRRDPELAQLRRRRPARARR